MATATVAIYARVSTYQQEDGSVAGSLAGCEQIEGPSGGFAEDRAVHSGISALYNQAA